MVTGFTKFKEKFQGFEDQYVVIGGTACDLLMENEDMSFRATKDVDIVLIVESITAEFGKAFWDYIKEAEYEHKNKSTGLPQFYRFSKPQNKDFPSMIELFSKKESELILKNINGLTPLHIDDEISSLSAILLNDSYYEVLKNGIKLIDGLSVLSVESLVLFKIKAWLDLSNRKSKGENIDSSDIKKHKNDIFRLSTLILGTETLYLPEEVKSDVVDFCKKMETETVDLKNLNIKTTKESIIQRYKTIFDV